MFNTRIRSFKSFTLVLATSLLCCAGLGTAAQANHPPEPRPSGPPPLLGPGKACVVIRHHGAKVPGLPVHAGHIGWAVEIGQDRYLFGAVENASSDGSAGWSHEGRLHEMLAAFENPGHSGTAYDAIKCIEVAQPNPAAAIQVGWTMSERSKHYNLRTKNCLHATYAVIHAYGATGIPHPSWFDMLPNKYYKDFKGHERLLHR